jgi:hypothetical protein
MISVIISADTVPEHFSSVREQAAGYWFAGAASTTI